jgi:hypothetical protein
LKLVRFIRDDRKTIGRLEYENLHFFTVERPWLGNKPNISCIPDGNYTVKRVDSPKFGKNMWEVSKVRNRTHILIHVANYTCDVEGCIGLGTGVFNDIRGVSNSKAAVKVFYDTTKELEEFELTIYTGALG